MSNPIVPTTIPYTSTILFQNLTELQRNYPFLNVQIIGRSVLGTPIPCIKLGVGKKQVFYTASIHANEWITSVVLMKFIEDFCVSYVQDSKLYGYSTKDIFANTSIFLVPMVNPDGVDLVTGKYVIGTAPYTKAQSISNAYPQIPFPDGWKANLNGVDLNLQFPAGWERARQIKFSQGYTSPAPRDFVGFGPLTEPEAFSIYDFTLSHNFRLILAYHSQGEIIYWKYADFLPPESEYIGRRLAQSSGYSLDLTPPESAFAGYKDWFIQEYNRPGYTIEVGLGENPLPISQFPQIYQDNLGILVLSAVL